MGKISTTAGSTLFKPEIRNGIISKVKGHSTLAKLCAGEPIPFSGVETFTFSLDDEVCIVGEAGEKPAGGATWGSVTVRPLKVIYQHRVTEEFLHMADEKRIPYMAAFTDGFSKKIARGIDIMGFHGLNPFTRRASEQIGTNSFDGRCGKTVSFLSAYPDDNIDAAVGLVKNDECDVTGIAMSPTMGSALGAMKMADSHAAMYPEFRFGGNPSSFGGGLACDVNSTVDFNSGADMGIVGDFRSAFKWGYSEQMKFEIITYGDPDGLGDLKRKNEICLRGEAYVGWGILDPNAFARIVNTTPFAVPAAAATAATKMFDVNVSSMQSGVSVADGRITGTLKYLKAENAITVQWGKGNFLCLDFSATDWTAYSSVMVGLDDSAGGGLVELINDPDKNGFFKISNKDTQRLMVVTTSADGRKKHIDYYDLSGLLCEVQ